MSNRNRTPVRLGRSRSEIITASIIATAIVLFTGLAIWLIRPGDPGVPGGGGLASRQPRVALLVSVAFIAAITVVVRLIRRPVRRLSLGAAIAIGLGAVLLVVVVIGFVWPGGLLRKYEVPSIPVPPTPPSTPASGPATSLPPTTAPGTTVPGTTAPTGSSGG